MAPPLAGKPPFATDEPDAYYEGSPAAAKRRVAPAKPENPNKRSSAYDVYENYLAPGQPAGSSTTNNERPTSAISTATSRNSGIGGIGMGLLAMDSDDDDSDDDEAYERKRKAEKEKREREAAAAAAAAAAAKSAPANAGQQSKNAALAAAVANGGKPSSPSSSPNLTPNAANNAPPPQRSPPPIAAPQPGYASPAFAQLDSGFGKSPSPIENPFEPAPQGPPGPQGGMPPPPPPHMRGPPGPPGGRAPPAINMNMGMGPGGPPGPRLPPPVHSPGGIVRSMTPAPLAPPMTPILPVFAVGPKSTPSPSPDGENEKGGAVKWDDLPAPTPRKPIMRGGTEDVILPRRGEKGDDFWRRFSMIAKVDMQEKSKGGKGSSWLRRTENGKQRLSRWVWVIGIVLLLAIGGASGLGYYLSRGTPDHQQPEALGGKVGNQTAAAPTSAALPVGAGRGGGGGTPSTSSKLHVSPTHTIENREFVLPVLPTPLVGEGEAQERRDVVEEHQRRSAARKRRF